MTLGFAKDDGDRHYFCDHPSSEDEECIKVTEQRRQEERIADARKKKGPVSQEEAIKMARQVAEQDDEEGLGEINKKQKDK